MVQLVDRRVFVREPDRRRELPSRSRGYSLRPDAPQYYTNTISYLDFSRTMRFVSKGIW